MNTEIYKSFNPETEDMKRLLDYKIKYLHTLPEDAKNRRYLLREIEILQNAFNYMLKSNLAYSFIETDISETINKIVNTPNSQIYEGILFFYAINPNLKETIGALALHSNDPTFTFSPKRTVWDPHPAGGCQIKEYITLDF